MSKRDLSHLNIYLDKLEADLYEQPEDVGHTKWAKDVFKKWIRNLDIKSVIDVGAGQGFCQEFFKVLGVEYTGIALGDDVIQAKAKGRNVVSMDMNFMSYPDESFDLVFSRHSLEHSPMPLIALLEWFRVSKHLLCLILPNPEAWGWTGLNHYSVLHPNQVEFLLKRAGWNIIWTDFSEPKELRYMAEKITKSEYEMNQESK